MVIGDVLDAGYRHIDTAHCYHTELPIGRALASRFAAGKLSRKEVWVTTKTSDPILSTNSYMRNAAESSYDGVLHEFAGCLDRLGLTYVDTLLLHWPGDKTSTDVELQTHKRADMWRALETIYARGQARSIGVSNFTRKHLEPLLATCSIVPHVNQIECHTRQQQHELVEYCHSNNICCTAYSPISGSELDDPVLQRLAAVYGVGPGDIVLRWLKQRGIVAIPKVCVRDTQRNPSDGQLHRCELLKLCGALLLTAVDDTFTDCQQPHWFGRVRAVFERNGGDRDN